MGEKDTYEQASEVFANFAESVKSVGASMNAFDALSRPLKDPAILCALSEMQRAYMTMQVWANGLLMPQFGKYANAVLDKAEAAGNVIKLNPPK